MPVLQVNDQRFTLQRGPTRLGAGEGVDVRVGGSPGVHAIIELGEQDRAVIRRSGTIEVRVNGIALGMEPTPLFHGDKVEIGGGELLFIEDAQAGETRFVSASEAAAIVTEKRARAQATRASGGRLVSLVDGKEYTVPPSGLTIGRDAASDVVVAQSEVSRRHAEIHPDEQGYVLRDLSTNGVFVNGDRVVQSLVLKRSDVLRIGTEEFRFHADVADPAAAGAHAATTQAPPPPPPPRAVPPAPARAGASTEPDTAPSSGTAPRAAVSAPRQTAPATAAPSSALQPAPLLASLEIINEGIDKGKRFEIRVPVANVGRGEHNDVVIQNDSVSDVHAKLMLRDDGWHIADADSTNGTYVAGSRLIGGEVRRLEGTPDVRFGGVKTIFRSASGAAAAAKGTRAIAGLQYDRAERLRERTSAPLPPAQSGSNPWIWVLIVTAAAVAAYLLINL